MDWSEQQAKYGALIQPGQKSSVTPKKSGGLTGFIYNAGKAIAHPFAELGTAAYNVPAAIKREVQNKPITDIQKRVFGTADSGSIAKKIIGDTAQVGLAAVAPEAGSIAKNAAVGAGYGASSALGEDKSNLESIVKGGITGGITGGAIGAGGKILNKLTGKVESAVEKGASKVAAKVADKEAAQSAAQRVLEEEPYSAISKTGRERGNMRSTLDFFKNKLKMGTEPTDLKKAAELATGDNGVISGTMRKLLGDTGNVPTSNVLEDTKAALIREAGQLGDVETKGSHANGVLRSVRDTLQGTAYKGQGNLSGTGAADANAVFDTLQSVQKRISELGDVGADAAEKRALKAAKGALEDSIYKNGGLDKAVAAYKLAPEDISAIHSAALKSGVSPETAQHIVEGINTATSGHELRSLQAPFVNASKLADVANRAGQGVLTDLPKTASESQGFFAGRGGRYNALELAGLLGGNPIQAIPLAANLAASANEKVGPGILQKLGEKAVETGQKFNSLPGGTNNIISKVATTGASTQQPEQPQNDQVATEGYAPVDNTAEAFGQAPQPTSGSIFNSDVVQRLIIEDLAQNQGKNVPTLLSLYNAFGKTQEPTAADKKAQTAAKNAEGTLSQIESSFNAAGGGQGRIGGFLNNIAGKVGANSNVATYNDTATALAASLYKALGNTGTISDKDQQLIARLIPKTTDTDTTAKAKVSQLRSLLQQAESNLVTQ